LSPFRTPHSANFERIANFRDLGGHTTRDGARVRRDRLFRSGHLGHASDADIEQLAALGIRRVFDFRNLADIESDGGDRLPDGTRHHRLPMPNPAAARDLRSLIQGATPDKMEELFGEGRAAALMVDSAAELVRDRNEVYAEFLAELARAESLPALFHCSAGKDRAGWAGTVVLLALGVDEEQVVEQYLLSNRNLAGIRKRLDGDRDVAWGGYLRPFLEVRPEYIESSFAAMRETWGSFDRYLAEGLSISDQQRDQLRELLLD
jgi:protein-tyrosine phosphatase